MRAIRLFAALLIANPALWSSTAAQQQGIEAFKEGRYSVAFEKLKTLHDPTSRAFFALTQAAMGECRSAMPALLTVAPAQSETFRLSRIGAVKCYEAQNEFQKAFALLDALRLQFPNDPDVLYLSAKLHMRAFNEATLSMYGRAPSSYRVHELSGEIFEVEDRYADAAAEYRKAIEANPNAPELHFRLGRALLLESHSEQALNDAATEFRNELKLSPEDSACYFQLGQIAQVQGKPETAIPEFERALALSPDFVHALIALGKLESQRKQYPRAIDLLTRATRLQPANETAHYALMTTYRDFGQMDKAGVEKATLDRLQKPPEGEFTEFLKKLGEKPPQQ